MSRFFIPLLLLTISACASSYDEKLLNIENAVELNSDSAAMMIDSFPIESYPREADRALYNLLNTRVHFESYIRNESDSLIENAACRFSRQGDTKHLMQARYIQASKCFYENDDRNAILLAMQAHNLALEFDDVLWKARTAELIGEIYSSTYLHEEALAFRKQAADDYHDSGCRDKHLMAMANVAISYNNLGLREQSQKLMDSVMCEASEEPVDSSLWYHVIRVRFIMSMLDKDYVLADSLYPPFKTYMKSHNYKYDRVMAARLEALHGYKEKALATLDSMSRLELDNITGTLLYSTISDIYASLGQFENAYRYKQMESRCNDKAQGDIIRQPATMAMRDFYNEAADTERMRFRQLRVYIVFGLIIFVLSAIWLRWHIRMTMRIKKAELETALADLSSLYADLSRQKRQNEETNERLRHVYSQQWSTLNMLSSELNTLEDNDISRKRILRQIESEMRKMATPENLHRLVCEADTMYEGLFSRLKQQLPDIKDMDIAILVMMTAGMNTYTQCYLTGMNRNTYYSRRRRLLARLTKTPGKAAAKVCRLINAGSRIAQ